MYNKLTFVCLKIVKKFVFQSRESTTKMFAINVVHIIIEKTIT